MKKIFKCYGKCLLFIITNIILMTASEKYINIGIVQKYLGNSNDVAIACYNSIKLFIVVFLTCFFILLWNKKNKIKIFKINRPVIDILYGIGFGLIYSAAGFIILKQLNIIGFISKEYPLNIHLAVYILALLIHSSVVILLVRGYVYNIIEKEQSELSAIIVSSIIYMISALKYYKGDLYSLINIFMFGVISSFLLSISRSVISVIFMDFSISLVYIILTGLVTIEQAYPVLYRFEYFGSGGLKGCFTNSRILIYINLIAIIFMLVIKLKKASKK